MQKLRELLQRLRKNPTRRPVEIMTTPKVDFSFRIYWTKMTRTWSADRRAEVRQQVLALIQNVNFEQNLIEKRYHLPLDDVPETMHSGASLAALVDVLNAFDAVEKKESEQP